VVVGADAVALAKFDKGHLGPRKQALYLQAHTGGFKGAAQGLCSMSSPVLMFIHMALAWLERDKAHVDISQKLHDVKR
jgi:hypothetical protein